MRKASLVFLLGFLFSLGAADFCPAQWQPFAPEVRGWEIDVGSGQFWLVERDFPHRRSRRDRAHQLPISLPEGRMLKPEEANTIFGIIKDDFLVNDDTTGGCRQWYSAIAMDTSGNFVVCWEDYRNGELDIYAQRFTNSGDILGPNFMVNNDLGSTPQLFPSIAMNEDGDFVICWEDKRNGDWDIYAQRFTSSGDTVGGNFRVNHDEGTSYQRNPSIAMDGEGTFVICWEDERNGEKDPDIYAQQYGSSGDTLRGNFRVNDDEGTSAQRDPSVAMDGDGGFVICWEDPRNGNWDIYAQRYSCLGDTVGSNFQVNDEVETSSQWSPSVATDKKGNFVICWGEGYYNIYAQRYSSSGDTLGGNFRVNDDVGEICQKWYSSVAMDRSGDFVISWADNRNDNMDIYAQRFNSSGDTLGSNFRVNDDEGTSWQEVPSVAMDGEGDFIICWEDERNEDSDIYAQRYNSLGHAVGANFQVNDDARTSWQYSSSVVKDGNGDFVICWQDKRNANYDIYAQRYEASGNTLGTNFKVNDDTARSLQRYPSIGMNVHGNFIICWEDSRNVFLDIYARRYDSSGDTLGGNFRVNDDEGASYQQEPSVAMDESGNFVICWADRRNGDWDENSDIYAQRYDSLGNPLGGNFQVNDNVGTSDQKYPSVAMDGSGNFIICWEDERNGNWDIYAQRYSNLGDTVGSNFQVNDNEGTSDQLYPRGSMGSDGNFIISWDDYREDSSPDIYAQRYSISGDTLGSNFRVNDDEGENWQSSSSIAIGRENDFIICWHDYRNSDCDIYAQRYHSDGTRWGINYLVNQKPAGPNPIQWGPSIALNDDIITFSWTDARRSKGWDIYAKVVTWDWDKVDEPRNNDFGLPQNFALSQNYPNPFNSTTAISYQLSGVRPHHTTLRLYNILGQEVKTLVDEEQPGGNYRVQWDGRDDSGRQVASGVYFYRLKVTGNRSKVEKTKKMVILR